MQILVINPGSSSIKFSLFEEAGDELRSGYEGELSGIGGAAAKLEFRGPKGEDLAAKLGGLKAGSMAEAIATVERAVGTDGVPAADAVGYRVVHPGAKIKGHQRVTPEVLEQLRGAAEFAPLHDPAAVEMIEEMMRRMPEVPHYACFDTVFHETMPEEATVYALPEAVRAKGVKRFGFHGLSCESIVRQMRETPGVGLPRRMLIAHLGSGCSVTACVDGESVDTTMGLTPTGGVVMGTRPGDLDPGVVMWLMRQPGATVESVERMLNNDAGLKALGGVNDMRALRKAEAMDAKVRLALDVFCRSLVRTMAGMAALHEPGVIVFSGGIGENDAKTRGDVCGGLRQFDVELDRIANELPVQGLRKVSVEDANVQVYVVPAKEDWMIARHVREMVDSSLG